MEIRAGQQQAIKRETMVSMAINGLIQPAIIWILDVSPPQTLLGAHPIARDMLAASGIATMMMTFMLTAVVRMHVRKGAVAPLHWPRDQRGWLRFIPQNLAFRGILLGLAAIFIFVPIGLVVVGMLGILPLTKIGFLTFNILFGALVGLVMARFIILPALADGVSPRS